jgi:hypothetical protein
MYRFSSNKLNGGVIAIAALAAAFLWIVLPQCSLPQRLYRRFVLRNGDTGNHLQFKFVSAGSGSNSESNAYSFTVLRASDCVTVILKVEEFGSPSEARVRFEKMLAATTTSSTSPLPLNQAQHAIGERVVLSPGSEGGLALILHLDGLGKLHTIESKSLSDALELEKQINKPEGYRFDAAGYLR